MKERSGRSRLIAATIAATFPSWIVAEIAWSCQIGLDRQRCKT